MKLLHAAYNFHHGLRQCCWVYSLRDEQELKEHYPNDAEVQLRFIHVTAFYERACAYDGFVADSTLAKQEAARKQHQQAFE